MMKARIRLYSAGLELTTACPCRCETCGTDAGRARDRELDEHEWCTVVRDLAGLGCRRATLLGGEPLLSRAWRAIVAQGRESGVHMDLITSAVGLAEEDIEQIASAGLVSVTVSVDGTREVHDVQRRVPGCFDGALRAIERLDAAGMKVGVTTQVNVASLPTLEDLAPLLQRAGAMGWQLQLTLPAGRAAGSAELGRSLVIEPGMMPEVAAVVRRLVARKGLRPFITDNMGWCTPDDPLLRTPPRTPPRGWMGCMAGLRAIGVTSDGHVKGCLSLPDSMTEGSVREEALRDIWLDPARFAYNRAFDPASLGGECASCRFGPVCRGGCTALAVHAHGRPGVTTHCLRMTGAVVRTPG